MKSNHRLISDQEAQILWQALCQGEGREVSEAEFRRFMDWAIDTRCNFALLDMVLDGTFVAREDRGKYCFMFPPGTQPQRGLRLPPE